MRQVAVMDADGAVIKVFPSSGAEVYGPLGVTRGPFVWVDIEPRQRASAACHLTRAQATKVRDALTKWLMETDGDHA